MRTLRNELLDRSLSVNERQLRALLREYIEHYNSHRPQWGLDQHARDDDKAAVIPIAAAKTTKRRSTSAGLINEYRAAA